MSITIIYQENGEYIYDINGIHSEECDKKYLKEDKNTIDIIDYYQDLKKHVLTFLIKNRNINIKLL